MQQQPQQPQLTPAQVQQQLQMQQQNLLWNQKQTEVGNAWNRENTAQQQKVLHTQFMVEHIATPMVIVSIMVIVALLIAYIVRTVQSAAVQENQDDNAAQVQQNKDNNAADVREAKRLLEKMEGAA